MICAFQSNACLEILFGSVFLEEFSGHPSTVDVLAGISRNFPPMELEMSGTRSKSFESNRAFIGERIHGQRCQCNWSMGSEREPPF